MSMQTLDKAVTGLLQDVRSQLHRLPEDFTVLKSIVDAALNDGLVNDRKFLLEHLIQLVVSLPPNSGAVQQFTGQLLDNLWDNLRHPPLSEMGDLYRYRAADGSYNNIASPNLGKSGSYYARSVVPTRAPLSPLPDPGIIFDTLYAREGKAKEHPAKFSSFAIALATIIIHDVMRTDDQDWNKVASSSYLDLGPLYGNNQDQQNKIRTFQDGKLKPDAFTEARILGQPPGVCALLVSFNRFHNYAVSQLALINENGRFSLPAGMTKSSPGYEKAAAKRDNDLFQTGRLITCGLYVNIILNDYVRVILNLNRSTTTWTLDPRANDYDVFNSVGTPEGVGNQVSIEFNLIYRWHATISDKNAAWMQSFLDKIIPGQDPTSIDPNALVKALKAWAHQLPADPGAWIFGDLKRTETGSFSDADLVGLLTAETEDVAGAFGARNVPALMRAIEILGIEQGRAWGAASLNEVRKFFHLEPHKTFLDINSDPEVATALEALYTEPDNVELYPGLCSEEAKPPMAPGSGLCAGYTITKAILSDAVALVRGDRYYSVDSSPANLTAFGFAEIAADRSVNDGVCAYKLLQRAYPGWYRENSVYALFPFTIPPENREILKAQDKEALYSYDPPSLAAPPTPITTWQGCVDVLKDQQNYKVPWGPHVTELIHHDWMLSGDKPWNTEQKKFCWHALYSIDNGLDQIKDHYYQVTSNLVKSKSLKLRHSYQLDAVRDVGNLSHAMSVAHIFDIPLKEDNASAVVNAQDLYDAMSAVFAYTFLDIDPAKTFALRVAGEQATALLAKAIEPTVTKIGSNGIIFRAQEMMKSTGKDFLKDYGVKLIQRLFEGGKSIDEVTWTVLPTSAAAVPIQTQGFASMLDFYLSPENASHWADIQKLAHEDKPEAFEKLRKYALEAYRLVTPSFGVLRIAAADGTIQDGQRPVPVKQGEEIFCDFVTAGVDPAKFEDADQVRLDRPDDFYIHHGYAEHACLGRPIVQVAMAAQLKVFGRLKNLRRAPGPAGNLKSTVVNGAFKVYMNEDWSAWTPFPKSMKVLFDDFE